MVGTAQGPARMPKGSEMTAPHPVYRDAEYLYTLRRDDRKWAISMIPLAQGLRGDGHVIAPENADDYAGAQRALREYARQFGMEPVSRFTRGGLIL